MGQPPIYWWRMEDVNPVIGGQAFTNNGSVAFSAGKYNNAADGDATNGKYLSNTAIQVPSLFTIEFWLYQKAYSSYNPWFTNTDNDGTIGARGILIRPQSSGAGQALFWNNAGATGFITGIAITDNTWTHMAFTYDGSNIRGYKDGSIIGSPVALAAPFDPLTGVWLGNGQASRGLYAKIDNLKIYDYVKSDFSDRFQERGGMNDSLVLG